jgi:hypothetical protein
METTQRQGEAVFDRMAPKIQEAQERMEVMSSRIVTFVKKNPGACLLGALGLGFIVGRIVSR